MATVLTTPLAAGEQLLTIADALREDARAMIRLDDLWQQQLVDGLTPNAVKANMDSLLSGYAENMKRYGRMLGISSICDAATAALSEDDPLDIDGELPLTFATRWRVGSPPGVGWLRCGYGNSKAFLTATNAALGNPMIFYYDVGPNYDLFYGVKANDVIKVEGCSDADNDGLYTVKYDVAERGDNTAYGLENGDFGAGTGWTAGTDWTISGGKAQYSDAAGTTARTLTNALTGMVAGAAYQVQFDLTVAGTDPVGTLTVSLGGDVYWKITTAATAAVQTYSFVTNAPTTTPTLTFTATRATGTFTIDVDNVYVYGAPVLYMVENFASDVGADADATTVITLEQTAA